MPQFAVHGPLDECHLDDDTWLYPVNADSRQARTPGEWRRRNFEGVELRPQATQQVRIEAGSDFPGEDEIVLRARSHEQRAEPDPRSPRIGEAADDEVLPD